MNNPPYLALDLGDRYIGTSFSEAGFLAKEVETIDRKNLTDEAVFEKINQLIENHQIQTLVVGLPVNADGTENDRCARIRNFMKRFTVEANGRSPVPNVIFFPEDFSSFDAKEQLKEKTNQKDKFQPDHALAAKIILERFIDDIGANGHSPLH